jgi:hypothetical protein
VLHPLVTGTDHIIFIQFGGPKGHTQILPLNYMAIKVKPLPENRILANHN